MVMGHYLRPALNSGGTYACIIRKLDGGEICRTQVRAKPFTSRPQPSLAQEESVSSPSTAFDTNLTEEGVPQEEAPDDDEIPTGLTD
jgi:hypothetical protein